LFCLNILNISILFVSYFILHTLLHNNCLLLSLLKCNIYEPKRCMLKLLKRIALLCITDFPRLSSTTLLQSSSQLLLTCACFCLVCGYQRYIHGTLIPARFHINRQLQCMVSECNTYQRPCGILVVRLEQFTNTSVSTYLYCAYPWH